MNKTDNLDPDIVAIIEKIGGPISITAPKPKPKPRKVNLSPLALRLLQRQEYAQRDAMVENAWRPHQFPPREVKTMWPESRAERTFDVNDRAYHGVPRTQEAGNLTHDLTHLIKSR
jgi:hypothetical protein